VEQGRTRFRSRLLGSLLEMIAVAQKPDMKNSLSRTREAEEGIHVRNCSRHILRYSIRCPAEGQGQGSSTNCLEADQEAAHSLHSDSYSSCTLAVAVDSAVVDHNTHHIAAGVEVHTSGSNNHTSKEAAGDETDVAHAAVEAEDSAGGAANDVACAVVGVEAVAADEVAEDTEHVEADVEGTEDVVNAGADAEDAHTDHNPLA
jgi:hypothetical protein